MCSISYRIFKYPHFDPILQLREYVKDSSGVNLVLKHLDSIPSSIFESCGVSELDMESSNAVSKEHLIENWITDEMKKKRVGKLDQVPPETLTLSELAAEITKTNKTLGSKGKKEI